jgi:DNA-binding SARP family transcriptional activator
VQRLLAFLALKGRPLHRAYIAGRLWIDHSQEHADGCLRTTLWRMGQLPCPVVDVTSRHLALAADVVVDARELEACIERVLHNGAAPLSGDIDLLIQAAELLPDWYDDWVFHERERLRQLRLVALEAAGEGLIGEGRYSDAAVAALAATASDPFPESSTGFSSVRASRRATSRRRCASSPSFARGSARWASNLHPRCATFSQAMA